MRPLDPGLGRADTSAAGPAWAAYGERGGGVLAGLGMPRVPGGARGDPVVPAEYGGRCSDVYDGVGMVAVRRAGMAGLGAEWPTCTWGWYGGGTITACWSRRMDWARASASSCCCSICMVGSTLARGWARGCVRAALLAA